MSLRTIMIFPRFQNADILDRIRAQYDPLASLVRPHITLVFPFESPMSTETLSEILHHRLQDFPGFPLELHGITGHTDDSGHYLFLNVIRGSHELCALNRLLYDHEFHVFDRGYPYLPHMTLGKLPSHTALENAFAQAGALPDTFSTVVNTISVERIGEHGESNILFDVRLR